MFGIVPGRALGFTAPADETASASPKLLGRFARQNEQLKPNFNKGPESPNRGTSTARPVRGGSLRQQRRDIGRATATAIAAVAVSIATVSLALWLGVRLVKTEKASTEAAKTEAAKADEAKTEGVASKHYLSFFADEQDAPILIARLNADPEIAFLVPGGPPVPPPPELMPALPPAAAGQHVVIERVMAPACEQGSYWDRWRAVRPVDGLSDGEHILWHIAAGPLIADGPDMKPQPITDAWAGWTSKRPVCGPNIQGAAAIRLTLRTRHAAYTPEERTSGGPLVSYWIDRDLLVDSDFQWSGASLLPDGSEQTARWATSLEDWFNQNAVQLHARNSTEVFWAFPSALQRLKAGLRYDARNYELDDSIRSAR